jgi:hypothetical protein
MSILPKEFVEAKDDSEARLIFMLNSSLLSYLISGLSIIGGMFGLPCSFSHNHSYCSSEFVLRAFGTVSPLGYLIIGMIFGLFGYFLYLLAVSAGQTFCSYVRAGFDLYRFDLLKKFNLNIPKTIENERDLWSKVNELLTAGDDLGIVPQKIKYATNKK